MNDIHSCGYHCDRPACIKAQRNDLAEKYMKLAEMHALALNQNQMAANMAASGAVVNFQSRLADAIEAMPFGDTAASFANFVRDFK